MRLKQLPKKRIVLTEFFSETKRLLREYKLNTICVEAKCPNIFECFSQRKCTFLIMGKSCSRACSFCSVKKGKLESPDEGEAERIAEVVKKLGLDTVVLTSVTRDDLPLGGANYFKKVVEQIRRLNPDIKIEVLVPDFQGNFRAISMVVSSAINLFAHNIETVQRLYPVIKKGADYHRSLNVLKIAKDLKPSLETKTALLLGMGEEISEVRITMKEIKDTGCDILVLGQYLQSSPQGIIPHQILSEEEFEELKSYALHLGFKQVYAGTWMRSSYVS